jgi:hypothetical protein
MERPSKLLPRRIIRHLNYDSCSKLGIETLKNTRRPTAKYLWEDATKANIGGKRILTRVPSKAFDIQSNVLYHRCYIWLVCFRT